MSLVSEFKEQPAKSEAPIGVKYYNYTFRESMSGHPNQKRSLSSYMYCSKVIGSPSVVSLMVQIPSNACTSGSSCILIKYTYLNTLATFQATMVT